MHCLHCSGDTSAAYYGGTVARKMHARRNKQILLSQQNRKLQKPNNFSTARSRKFSKAFGERRGKGRRAHVLNSGKLMKRTVDLQTPHKRYQLRNRSLSCHDMGAQSFGWFRIKPKFQNLPEKPPEETKRSRVNSNPYCEELVNDVVDNVVENKLSNSNNKDDAKWCKDMRKTSRFSQHVAWSQNQIKRHAQLYHELLRHRHQATSSQTLELKKMIPDRTLRNDVVIDEDSTTLDSYSNTVSLMTSACAIESTADYTGVTGPGDSEITKSNVSVHEFPSCCHERRIFQTRRRMRSRGQRWRNGHIGNARHQKRAKLAKIQVLENISPAVFQEGSKTLKKTCDDSVVTVATDVDQLGLKDCKQTCFPNAPSTYSESEHSSCKFSGSKVVLKGYHKKGINKQEFPTKSNDSSVTLGLRTRSELNCGKISRISSSTSVMWTRIKSALEESKISMSIGRSVISHSHDLTDLSQCVVATGKSRSTHFGSPNVRPRVESRIPGIKSLWNDGASVTSVPSLCDVADSGVFIDSSLPTLSDAPPVISASVSMHGLQLYVKLYSSLCSF